MNTYLITLKYRPMPMLPSQTYTVKAWIRREAVAKAIKKFIRSHALDTSAQGDFDILNIVSVTTQGRLI